ncbi:MAG: FecR domain-containing protein [Chloroflexi bacterium]|nr:FecR domain-containing protein [Chloroflexota bacterium]
MTGEVVYRTKSGNISTAISTPLRDPRSGHWTANQATAAIIALPGGRQLLLGVLAGLEDGNGELGKPADRDIKAVILQKCIEQSSQDVAMLPLYAMMAAEREFMASPGQTRLRWGAVCVAIQEDHLVLAHRGSYETGLIRKGRFYSLTQRPRPEMMHDPDLRLQQNILFPEILGKDEQDFIDSEIYMPGSAGMLSIKLLPGDGILLSRGEVMKHLTAENGGNLLHRGFLSLYLGNPVEVTANSLARFAAGDDPEDTQAVVVMKSEDQPPSSKPPRWRGSCLWQAGILFLILIVSAALGLGAAYGLPRLMNPKPVPVTGAGGVVPPGFFLVEKAGAGVQYATVSKNLTPLVSGGLIEVTAGTQIRTAQGEAEFKMSDGSQIVLGNSTEVTFFSVANPSRPVNSTNLSLELGNVLVSDTSTAGTGIIVTTPDQNLGKALGDLYGVTYTPEQNRFDLDCLRGACKLLAPTTSRDLQAGQHSFIMDGVIGGLDAARVSDWTALCGSMCTQQAQSPTPTPYLGSGSLSGSSGAISFLGEIHGGEKWIGGLGLPLAGFLAIGLVGAGLFRVSWAFIRLIWEGEKDEDEDDNEPPQ